MREILRYTGCDRIVGPVSLDHVQMKADGIVQPGERSIVEEAGRDSQVPKGRCAELIAISTVARDLFQAEILILSRSVTLRRNSGSAGVIAPDEFIPVGNVLVPVPEKGPKPMRCRIHRAGTGAYLPLVFS